MMKAIFHVLSIFLLMALIVPGVQAQEALTETFTTADGSLSIMYPAGWYADEDVTAGSIGFYSNPDLVSGGLPSASGDMAVSVFLTEILTAEVRDAATIHDAIASTTERFGVPMLEVVDFTVGDHPATRASFQSPDFDGEFVGLEYGDAQRILALGITFSGELGALEPVMLAMIESLTFGAGAAATDTPAETTAPAATTTTISLAPSLLWTAPPSGQVTAILDIALSPDDQMVAVSEIDGNYDVGLLNAATGEVVHTLAGNTQQVSHVAFSPDSSMVASTGTDGTLHLWDTATGAEMLVIQKEGQLGALAFSPDGDSLVFLTNRMNSVNTIWRLDIASGQDEIVFNRDDNGQLPISEVVFSPDGGSILFDSADYSGGFPAHSVVYQLDLTTNEAAKIFDQPAAQPLNLFYAGDSLLAAVTPEAQKITQVWDVTSNTLLYTLPEAMSRDGSGAVATTVAVVNDEGTILATGSINVEAQLWDAQTGEPLVTLDRGLETIDIIRPTGFAFSHDGSRLAVSYGPPTIAMWSLTGEAVETPADAGAATEAAPAPTSDEGSTSTAATCTLTAPANANLRSGAGTNFDVAASLAAGQTAEADGRTIGSDGMLWYRLTSGSWVRNDIINAAAECDTLPDVSG